MIGLRLHIVLSLVLVAIFVLQLLLADDALGRWLAGVAVLAMLFQTLALIFRPHWIRNDLGKDS